MGRKAPRYHPYSRPYAARSREPTFPRPVTGPTVGHYAAAPRRTKRGADRALSPMRPSLILIPIAYQYKGMKKRGTVIIPTARMKLAIAFQHFLPEPVLLKLIAGQQKKKSYGK